MTSSGSEHAAGTYKLKFPFYEDIGDDRWFTKGFIEYSLDGGTNWKKLIEFEGKHQNNTTWYWLEIKKSVADKIITWPTYRGSASVEITSELKEYDYRETSSSEGFCFAEIQWTSSSVQNAPVIFHLYSDIEETDVKAAGTRSWNLFGRAEAKDVTFVKGNPMHAPQIGSTTINTNGTVSFGVSIPAFNSVADLGTYAGSYMGSYWDSWNGPRSTVAVKIVGASSNLISQEYTQSIQNGILLTPATPWTKADFNTARKAVATTTRLDFYPSTGTSKSSDEYTIAPYPCPDNLTAEANNGKITLTWDMTAGTSASVQDNYQIRWRRKGASSWTAVNGLTKQYVYTETKPTVTFDYPEMEAGTQEYEFLVARAKFNHDDKNYNTTSVPKTIVTNKRAVTGISVNKSSGNAIKIEWTADGGRIADNFRFRLYRREASGSYSSAISEVGMGVLTYTDNSPVSCTSYHYEIRLFDGSAESSRKESDSISIDLSNAGTMTEMRASKGFYNDRVNVTWKVSDNAKFNRYTVYRTLKDVPGAIKTPLTNVTAIAGATQYSYEDHNAIPGLFYTYYVEAWSECNGTSNKGGELFTTGFMQPYGVVSGKVSYGTSGQAVSGVNIYAASESGSGYAGKAMEFTPTAGTVIRTPYESGDLILDAFTFQAWLKSKNNSGTQGVYFILGRYGILKGPNGFTLYIYTSPTAYVTIYLSYTPTINTYYHVSITSVKQGNTITAKLYINGKEVNTGTVTYNGTFDASGSDSSAQIGHVPYQNGQFYNGFMDEFRLWKRTLSADEIARNYDCYLSGREEGLALYYRFDESGGDEVFDISGRNGIFNENHGKTESQGGVTMRVNDVPKDSELAIKAVTDSTGAYLINNIPYTGEGTLYTLTPFFPDHVFNPINKPMFFSQQASAHNNVDFTDISSFPVTGTVTYHNTDYPVEGVQILIDGIPANSEGKAITTTSQGTFKVYVPIGEHSITMEKQGHTFADGGRYPPDPDKVGTKINFQGPVDNLEFSDITTVRLMGRVVGGQTQTDMPLGFGLSKANIGKATVTLHTFNNYRLNLSTTQNRDTTATIGGKTTKTTFLPRPAGSVIEIETDSVTGEFVAILPPVPFFIEGVKAGAGLYVDTKGDYNNFTFSKTPSFDIDPSIGEQEVEYINPANNNKEVFAYHDSIIITRYNEPTISIIDRNAKPGAYGDSVYIYVNRTSRDEERIPLYDVDNDGKVSYPLGVPVLTQKTWIYEWEINAFEEYVNNDGAEPVKDFVPLAGTEIEISNALSSKRVDVDTTTLDLETTLSEESNTQLTLDDKGSKVYRFETGFPNINSPYTLSAKFSLNRNGKVTSEAVTAILFGQLPTDGNNFATKGPDAVDIVLHDPPGSNSYATLSSGSSYTTTTKYNHVVTVTETEECTFMFGPEIKTASGFGFLVMSEFKNKLDIEAHQMQEEIMTNGWEKTVTTTFNTDIQTSGDPNYIGAMADVFIGKSTNIIFGKMRQLALYPAEQDEKGKGMSVYSDKYRMFTKEILTSNLEFGTHFIYTQQHILETQIPNMKALRNQLITPVTNDTDTTSIYFAPGESARYFTFLSASDEHFGEPLTYYVFFAPDVPELEKVDEVQNYNTWIANWEERIRDNEKIKIDLFDSRSGLSAKNNPAIFENISYDAGTHLEKSTEVSYNHLEIDGFGKTAEGSLGAKTGFTLNEVGFMLHAVVGAKGAYEDQTDTGEGNTLKFGYVLSEDESVLFAGKDALTVDVYGPSSDLMQSLVKGGSDLTHLTGYTFRTRAGQTSCPHETADSTLFYEKTAGKKELLNYGTFKIEKADIYIKDPDPESGPTKAASAENIPAGREATFILLLQNNSEANLDVTYLLTVDPTSNPDGLVLSVDGEPLVAGRQIRIKYGEQQTKTLKVRQSSLDILDYSDIKICLGSVCDVGDYDQATISVHFTPSSSPVTLSANTTLANRAALEKGGKITLTASDYDRTFRNFGMIRLQYRMANEETWSPIKEFVNDPALFPLTEGREPITGYTIVYDWEYEDIVPSDGDLIFRALAVSKVGGGEITSPSNEILVTKDVRAPQALGNPSPVNGILNIGDEISITFNEDIRNSVFAPTNYDQYFSITGILNGENREFSPSSGLFFDGNANRAFTEMPIYAGGSFSIEGWIQRPVAKAGTLFAFGEGDNYFSLGIDLAGHPIVKIGSETFTSDLTVKVSPVWNYVGVSYNSVSRSVSVYATGETNPRLIDDQVFKQTPPTQGKLYVGNNAAGNDGFHGAVAMLHFYNTARTYTNAIGSRNENKSGSEPGLIGLWELEEGEGLTARDKSRARNLVLNTSWYVYPEGKSLAFNGTSQYALIISSNTFPFLSFDDFTYEFWFRGGNQGAATLLSAGTSLYVGFNASHELMLTAGVNTQTLAPASAGLLDDMWHHFALSVKRGGTTTAYIDGKAAATFNSALIEGPVTGSYCLAAKMTVAGNPSTTSYGEYFKGNIDEVRVWGSALTTDVILLEKNHKLRGTEAGLKCYFPFEAYDKRNINTIDVYESLKDLVSGNDIGNMTSWSNIGAPLQDARPVTKVPFTVTASERKIVLNITEEAYKLEGVTLAISVKDVLDTHDNPSSAYSWIAYVNRNALKWDTESVSLAMEQGSAQTFKATVLNRSGENTAYYLENVPAWLTVDAANGNLRPLTSRELTFTVSKALNTGKYEASIVVRGDNNVRETLPVTVKVTGERPDWSVNPGDFEMWMSVTGQIRIEGAPQEDEDDLLAAFIGDTCIGVASPKYEPSYQSYFVYMSIWGNMADTAKAITFKYWDASTGQVYPQVEPSLNNSSLTVKFVGNESHGTPDVPVIFNARDIIEQSIALVNGWNWISFNVSDTSMIDRFKTNAAGFAVQMKSDIGNGEYINYNGGSWTGSLTSLPVTKGYLFKTSHAATLRMKGKPVALATTPDTLKANMWSWIGYTPQFSLTVAEALAGVANPVQGDQIKGQTGYRIWSSNGWVGSLSVMEPGRGYMYRSYNASTVIFNYPAASAMLRSATFTPSLTFGSPVSIRSAAIETRWETEYYRFESSMTVTASLLLNGEEVSDGLYEIAAFSGDDCRGNALFEKIDGFVRPYMGFLMIFGNDEEALTLKVYDHSTGKEYLAKERIDFQPDVILGTPDHTWPVTLSGTTGNESTGSAISIYPNPVEKQLYIKGHDGTLDMLTVTDLTGKIIRIEKNYVNPSLDVSNLAAGMYILKIQDEGQTRVFKFIKK